MFLRVDKGVLASTVKFVVIVVAVLLGKGLQAQEQDRNDWNLLADASFNEIFVKELYTFKSLLIVDDHIKSLEGKELVITGYYIPVAIEENAIILSKTPFASCFFCGSAGQETVIDIRFAEPLKKKFTADDRISVKGILRLNDEDWDNLSFRLEAAVLIRD